MREIIFKNLTSQRPWYRDISISEIITEVDRLTELRRGAMWIVERATHISLEPTHFYVLRKEDSRTGEFAFCYETHSMSFIAAGNNIYRITQVSYHNLKIKSQKTTLNLGGCHGKP
jgi:hypothetical protein